MRLVDDARKAWRWISVQAMVGATALLAAIALWFLPWIRLPLALVGCVMEGACVVNNFRKCIRP